MSLAAGARLGPYEIVAPIGAGGMGEVYRARDPRLEPGRRDQGPSAVILRRRRPPPPVRTGGPRGLGAQSPQHHLPLRRGLARRHALRRQRATGGRDAALAPFDRRAPAAQGHRVRRTGRPRPRRRAREGHRPPGPQAREPLRHRGRPGQDPRLRPGQADPAGGDGAAADLDPHRLAGYRARRRHGHGRLHVARAGQGTARGPTLRHLLLRSDPLRDARGPPRFQRRLGGRDDVGDPEGRPAGSHRDQQEPLPGPRAPRTTLPRESASPEVPVRQRPRLRSRKPLDHIRSGSHRG